MTEEKDENKKKGEKKKKGERKKGGVWVRGGRESERSGSSSHANQSPIKMGFLSVPKWDHSNRELIANFADAHPGTRLNPFPAPAPGQPQLGRFLSPRQQIHHPTLPTPSQPHPQSNPLDDI